MTEKVRWIVMEASSKMPAGYSGQLIGVAKSPERAAEIIEDRKANPIIVDGKTRGWSIIRMPPE